MSASTAWLVALAAVALLVLVLAVASARRPEAGVADLDAYLERWSALHGGYDPRTGSFTRFWLPFVHRLAMPLARRGVQPDVVTAWGAVASLAVVACCAAGGWWVLAAVGVVAVSGILDNLDGAVAVMTGRSTRFGYVLDSLVDRVSDTLYVVALLVLGAPPWVAAAGAFLMFLQEYTRARAGAAGMSEVGVITVWERPTRVILTAFFLLGVFLWDVMVGTGPLGGTARTVAALGAWAWIGLGVVGNAQLLVAVRRSLTAPPPEA